MWNPYRRYPQNFQMPFNRNNINNRNIQNAIRFEPFNPNDLEKIKTAIKNPPEPQNKFEVDKIENALQNENNASIFYKHLISQIDNENAIDIIKKIENHCQQRQKILAEIYQSQTQSQFKMRDVKINKINNLHTGIHFAIMQEIESAQNLLEILHDAPGNKINFIYNQKLLDINYLNYLAQNFNIGIY